MVMEKVDNYEDSGGVPPLQFDLLCGTCFFINYENIYKPIMMILLTFLLIIAL